MEEDVLNFKSECGLLISDKWRYGPLYACLPIVASFFVHDIPITLTHLSNNSPEINIFVYDGENIEGNLEIISLVTECIPLIDEDLSYIEAAWYKSLT